MKNKNRNHANRAKKKHAKNVARKGKGAQYGASVKGFSKLKEQLQAQPREGRIVMGVDNKHTITDHETTSFVDSEADKKPIVTKEYNIS